MDETVHVWFAYRQVLDDAAMRARLEALLSPDESERRDRMKFEDGRREQLLTRGMLREVLSHHAPAILPRDWRFVRSDTGRPSLSPPFDATGLHFNVTHSGGLVAIAIGRMPLLGIDVEHETRAISPAIARRHFSASEVAALESLPPEQHQRHRLRLWTLKEAYLKAIGTGVAGGLGSATFGFHADGAIDFERDDDPHAKQWAFREFNPRGFMLALAYLDAAAGFPAQPRLREYRGRSHQEQRTQP